MRGYTWTENGFTFKRINKAQARRAYNNGLTVLFCPCNLRSDSPFWSQIKFDKMNCFNHDFDSVVNKFEHYNCTNGKTGRYTAFYIPVEYVDRFTGETPTAETLGTIRQYDYKYMEV